MKLSIGKVSISALMAMSGVLSSIPSNAETLYAAHGAQGDFAGELRCGEKSYVIGFEGGTGQIIDRIALRCAPIRSDGTALSASYGISKALGGGGGGANSTQCPAGSVVVAAAVIMNPANKQVQQLSFACKSANDEIRSLAFGGVGQEVSWHTLDDFYGSERNFRCHPGEAMSGLTVRYGEHVNALGLICKTVFPSIAVAEPAPPPEPLKSTGKARTPGVSVASIQAFQGGWQTVTSQSGHFTLILQITNPGQDPLLYDTYVTGQFINSDGATDYNGTLQGTIPRGTRTLTYGYSQPGISSSGQGQFTLSNDGNTLTGTGTSGDVSFTWNGTRAK